MKKIIFSAAVLVGTVAFAQTGKVGVNTAAPVRTLDVEGNLRVKTVTDQSANAAYSSILIQNPTNGLVDAVSKSFFSPANDEPWRLTGTNYATPGTSESQNLVRSGNITIGNTNGLQSKIGVSVASPGTILNAITIYNRANVEATLPNQGVSLGFTASPLTEVTEIVNYLPGNNPLESVLGIRNRNQQIRPSIEYLSIESNIENPLEGNVGINTKQAATDNRPTQKLDVNGNARIRELADGRVTTDFSNYVVAKPDGTLGIIPRTTSSISGSTTVNAAPLTTTAPYATTIPIITKNQKEGGDAASYVMTNSGGNWSIYFTDTTNSSSVVNYEIIFIPR